MEHRPPDAAQPFILEVKGVTKRFTKPASLISRSGGLLGFPVRHQTVHAVDDVSFDVKPGQVIGLVGESGCGKSTLGRVISGLHSADSGAIALNGVALEELPVPVRRQRQLAIQMIFQDPYASLNPRRRVIDIIGEAPVVQGLVPARQVADFVANGLDRVGLDRASLYRYPHQFSGGQRARIGIARALAVNPTLLVCDESVAALDVSIQAQVLNLFMQLRQALNLTYLFISHDLGVVRHISDQIVIMYLGRVVERGSTEDIFQSPNHPYTRGLLAEAPKLVAEKKTFVAIRGEIPSPLNPPTGCHFHPRCPHAILRCKDERPKLKMIDADRWSACHLNDRL